MKQIFTLILFSAVLYSCKKEIPATKEGAHLQMVEIPLKDSLGNADYSDLDFSKILLGKHSHPVPGVPMVSFILFAFCSLCFLIRTVNNYKTFFKTRRGVSTRE